MITTLRSVSPGRSVSNVQSNSITGMFSSSSFCRLCPPRQVAPTQISRHALYGQCVTSCSALSCCAALWGFCKLFRARSCWGWSRSFSCSSDYRVRFPAVFLLPLGSWLVPVCCWLHVLFHWSAGFFRIQEVGTVPVDIVAQNFFVIFWIAVASRMVFPSPQGLKFVIAPVSAPFFTDKIGLVATVTLKLTRISHPSPAVNWTFLRVP